MHIMTENAANEPAVKNAYRDIDRVICEWGTHMMTENAANEPAVENAFRDIDRYISEMSQLSSNDAQLLSLSQRLRVLGKQQTGSSNTQPAVQEIATPLAANEF
jgi:hypothetical protein